MENDKLFNKYLELLEMEAEVPTFELLRKIIKSHLKKIPFENISKLIFKKNGMIDIPNFEQYLNGIEQNKFGGTCYSLNYYLYLLLRHLGFDIKLCGADMSNPDVHIISMVNIDGEEFIIDCGYGAPLLEPMPRNIKKDHTIKFGYETYVIKPKSDKGTSKLEQYYKDELKHFYIAKPAARRHQEFSKVIKDSYDDKAMFMNAILITSFSEDYSVTLRNNLLTEIKDGKIFTAKISFDEFTEVVNEKFGMPKDLVKNAINDLTGLKDIY